MLIQQVWLVYEFSNLIANCSIQVIKARFKLEELNPSFWYLGTNTLDNSACKLLSQIEN